MSDGPMGVEGVGVCQQLSTPLAHAGVSVIYISTFNTDYVLVEEKKLAQTVSVLRANFEVFPSVPSSSTTALMTSENSRSRSLLMMLLFF